MKTFQHFPGITRMVAIAMVVAVAFTSCQEPEEVAPKISDPTPDLEQALTEFEAEFEYIDDANPESNERRRGPKRYLRKSTYFTLLAALKYTGLLPTVAKNKLTIFAPDDKAFAEIGLNFWNVRKLPKDVLTNILLYHVAEGFVFSKELPDCSLEMFNGSNIGLKFKRRKVFIKDKTNDFAKVIFTDKRLINSLFHGIDKVLMPPEETIATIASGNDDFSTLVFLLQETGLVGAVADPEANLTVFAPTNKAFEDLEAALPGITAYLLDNPDELTKVLLHHVSPGSTFSFCLSDGMMIPTLNEDNLKFDANSLTLESSSGNSVDLIPSLLDIHATNGVIHAIDFVLVPSNLVLPPS